MSWNEVFEQDCLYKGRLCLLEKDFDYSQVNRPVFTAFPFIKNVVEQIILKVLESGGHVDFVEPGMLEQYDHIAMIQHD